MITSSIFENIPKTDLLNFLQSHFNEGILSFTKEEEWNADCNADMLATLGFSDDKGLFPGLFNLMEIGEKELLISFLERAESEAIQNYTVKLHSMNGKVMTLKLNGFGLPDSNAEKASKFIFFY